MGYDGGWWPAGCTWLADICTRAKGGIKRREQMQEPVRSSNQALATDCLKEREESGLLSLGFCASFPPSRSENCGRDYRMAGRQAYRQGKQVSK